MNFYNTNFKNVGSFSFFLCNKYLLQRQILALGYVFVAGTDIITTYFGLERYTLHETIPWTSWIIKYLGWEGIILRFILSSIFFLYLFRYTPSNLFKWIRYPATVLLVVYACFTTINNIILILSKA